ncbi:MAG: hypothetical protein HYS98_04005, partial [Deltaproteobacteria bacterium]|nr:hypothetical protein [Deltaproteobacteria bacterium]
NYSRDPNLIKYFTLDEKLFRIERDIMYDGHIDEVAELISIKNVIVWSRDTNSDGNFDEYYFEFPLFYIHFKDVQIPDENHRLVEDGFFDQVRILKKQATSLSLEKNPFEEGQWIEVFKMENLSQWDSELSEGLKHRAACLELEIKDARQKMIYVDSQGQKILNQKSVEIDDLELKNGRFDKHLAEIYKKKLDALKGEYEDLISISKIHRMVDSNPEFVLNFLEKHRLNSFFEYIRSVYFEKYDELEKFFREKNQAELLKKTREYFYLPSDEILKINLETFPHPNQFPSLPHWTIAVQREILRMVRLERVNIYEERMIRQTRQKPQFDEKVMVVLGSFETHYRILQDWALHFPYQRDLQRDANRELFENLMREVVGTAYSIPEVEDKSFSIDDFLLKLSKSVREYKNFMRSFPLYNRLDDSSLEHFRDDYRKTCLTVFKSKTVPS